MSEWVYLGADMPMDMHHLLKWCRIGDSTMGYDGNLFYTQLLASRYPSSYPKLYQWISVACSVTKQAEMPSCPELPEARARAQARNLIKILGCLSVDNITRIIKNREANGIASSPSLYERHLSYSPEGVPSYLNHPSYTGLNRVCAGARLDAEWRERPWGVLRR